MAETLGGYYKRFGLLNTIRKLLYVFIRTFGFINVKRLKALFYFKTYSLRLGKSVRVYGLANHIEIGQLNTIYDNCIFHFNKESRFKTGRHVLFSYNVLVSCEHEIVIGNYVQIGEFTSIRDTTHQYDVDGLMMGTEDKKLAIQIGNNVWIGRGCLIREGTIIEDGVVVAANSVVSGRLLKDTIYGGIPAKAIKNRLTGRRVMNDE